MKVVLPVAGKGTRLLPVTKHTGKPLVHVAGRAVLDYVMDKLDGLDVSELIFITGHLKEQVEEYVRATYDIPARFVEQKVQDGTAGAVNLARPYVKEPVLIIFVDTVFDADLTLINRVDADGIIWAKEVEDYQRFGVIVTDNDGYMQRIIEKPSEPVSRLANIGLYYIRDWETLFAGIEETLAGPQQAGEWFLTEAFQYMIDRGKRILTAQVEGWYDCGKLETLLDSNRQLLDGKSARSAPAGANSRFVSPVCLADNVVVEDSTIGPNVSIDAGAVIRSSIVKDAIVGRNAEVIRSSVDHSLLGDDTRIVERELSWIIAAGEEVKPAP